MPEKPPDLRVLLVDHDRINAGILSKLLTACGYQVEHARTGPQAIKLADTFRPHALLSAVDLPGLDGFDLAHQIRAENPRVCTLFMANVPTTELRTRAAASASPPPKLLSKPPSIRALLEFLSNCADTLSPQDPQARPPRQPGKNYTM